MAEPRFTLLGKLVSIVLIAGLITLGGYMVMQRRGSSPSPSTGEAPASTGMPGVAEVQVEVPKLAPPAPVQLKDNIVPIEISEYAGYAGLIAANGGLEPNENSVFFKEHGFKVRLTVSEDEDWSKWNEGRLAASVTTVDVLAVDGRQFHAVVPDVVQAGGRPARTIEEEGRSRWLATMPRPPAPHRGGPRGRGPPDPGRRR